MIKILCNEEHGYKHWYWNYPGTIDELIVDWKVGKIPFLYHCFHDDFSGQVVEVEATKVAYEMFMDQWSSTDIKVVKCHIHMFDDSWLQVGLILYTYKELHAKDDAPLRGIEWCAHPNPVIIWPNS